VRVDTIHERARRHELMEGPLARPRTQPSATPPDRYRRPKSASCFISAARKPRFSMRPSRNPESSVPFNSSSGERLDRKCTRSAVGNVASSSRGRGHSARVLIRTMCCRHDRSRRSSRVVAENIGSRADQPPEGNPQSPRRMARRSEVPAATRMTPCAWDGSTEIRLGARVEKQSANRALSALPVSSQKRPGYLCVSIRRRMTACVNAKS